MIKERSPRLIPGTQSIPVMLCRSEGLLGPNGVQPDGLRGSQSREESRAGLGTLSQRDHWVGGRFWRSDIPDHHLASRMTTMKTGTKKTACRINPLTPLATKTRMMYASTKNTINARNAHADQEIRSGVPVPMRGAAVRTATVASPPTLTDLIRMIMPTVVTAAPPMPAASNSRRNMPVMGFPSSALAATVDIAPSRRVIPTSAIRMEASTRRILAPYPAY